VVFSDGCSDYMGNVVWVWVGYRCFVFVVWMYVVYFLL